MRGFTLIEIIIIAGITLIVGSVAIFNLTSFRPQNNLKLATEELVVQLRDAQSRAVSQDQGSKWGVHFEAATNESDWYEVFSGDSYATGIKQARAPIFSNLKFLDPVEGLSKDVIFAKLTGATSAIVIKIGIIDNESVFYTINVAANGLISYVKSQ